MKQQLAEMRTLKPAVRAALGLLAAGLALSVVLLSPSRSGNSVAAAWSQCRPRLIAYQPSEWEREWYKLATPKFVEKNTLCEAVALHPERVQAWVDGAISLAASISGRSFGSTRGGDGGANSSGKRGIQAAAAAAGTDAGINPSTVFSHFKWKDPCTGSTYLTPIEPLVGHMRHPLAPHCIPNSTVDIESKDYLLFSGLTPEQFQKTYPGRKLLMDFGAGQGYEGQELRSSLSYLLAHYEQMGVHFDEVWAWEPRPVNQSTYWQGVPPDVKFRLHLYNTGLEGDTTSPAHPIQYIKQNVQAGDFLVIKLDVDTQSVEIPFMRAVQADADLRSRIGEILFEMHYIHQDMPWFIGYGDGISYNDALNLFHSLRHEGLRIHYWP